MSQVDTVSRNLPVPIDIGARRSYFARDERGAPKMEFLSQLIADLDQIAPQRIRSRATPMEVLRHYDSGGKLALVRMPPGYRLDIDA
jgi:hypothetical protein